ncbi:MAG: NUDIX hydrolase [Gammaproteobacteria bacterium]|nr:NUDIX hydrolase [Gammaproteobacteria bacterium]
MIRRWARRLLQYTAIAAALSTPFDGISAQPPCRTAVDEPDFAFAAGCLVRQGERMLVVRHRYGGGLGVPGGRAGSGENAQCVAHRETWEETGVDVVVHELVKRFGNGFALYRCVPVADAVSDADELEVPATGRNEITRVIWVDPRATQASDWRFPRDYPEILRLIDD